MSPGHPYVRTVQAMKWPDPEAGPYQLKLYWQTGRGRKECIGVWFGSFDPDDPSWDPAGEVAPDETPPRVTASMLRQVPITSARRRHERARLGTASVVPMLAEMAEISKDRSDRIDEHLRGQGLQPETATLPQWGLAFLATREAPTGASRSGRPGPPVRRDDAHFQDVATIYRAAVKSGEHPLVAVAELHQVKRKTAANWVYRARQKGLLGPTTPGVAEELTDPDLPEAVIKPKRRKRKR